MPCLIKAPVDRLNYFILLILSHIVIARQAKTALEYIRTDIFYTTANVSVGSASSGSIYRDELVHPVHRLHMHGLPNRAAFSIKPY